MSQEPDSKKCRNEDFVEFDFTKISDLEPSGLTWINEPYSSKLDEAGLLVVPKPHSDFWSKRFCEPTVFSDSGHGLLYQTKTEWKEWSAELKFSLPVTRSLYDQAGILVYGDDHHVIKIGLEMVDGSARMSCVICDGESSWNYIPWSTTEDVRIRVFGTVYNRVCECKVEYFDNGTGEWTFLREGQLALADEEARVKVGLLCAAPKKEKDDEGGMEALFSSLVISGQK